MTRNGETATEPHGTRILNDGTSDGRPVRVLTIGHGNTAIAAFTNLLTSFAVQTLVDVRSNPYSRFAPQFNRETLAASLAAAGVDYRWAGESLGGRRTDATCYWSGALPEGKLTIFGTGELRRSSQARLVPPRDHAAETTRPITRDSCPLQRGRPSALPPPPIDNAGASGTWRRGPTHSRDGCPGERTGHGSTYHSSG